MTQAEIIRSNAEVHGLKWAANWCKRNLVPFDTFYFVMVGKYPTRH